MKDMLSCRHGHCVLAPKSLRYNPQDDIIFPSVLPARAHLPDAEAQYYLYYSPHSAPGGICVAFADDARGPWREHGANPVVSARWRPHYDVEHVSAAHALWREDRREIWLYYHGDNDCTRWATSADGIHFQYGGVAVHADSMRMDGASYARVFTSPFDRSRTRFVMVLLLYEYEQGSWDRFARFGLYGAWSNDGCNWDMVADPIISHADCAPHDFVCSPSIVTLDDTVWLLYHADRDTTEGPLTDVYAVAIDSNLRPNGQPRLVCAREAFGAHNERIADPYVFHDGTRWHLLGAIGPRLRQSIGWGLCDPMHPSF